MKKSSSKTSKKKSLNKKKITWLGIDIHHIALGVSVIGCLVTFLLVKQQKALEEQTQVLAAEMHATVATPFIHAGTVPPCDNCGVTPPPVQLTCIPRPPCLQATPRCMIAEPVGGWCHTPISPDPSLSPLLTPPPGCHYGSCTLVCPQNNPNCCKNYSHHLICPSGMPKPSISYLPRPSCPPVPTCNPKLGIACKIFPCAREPTFFPKPSCIQRPPCESGKICPQLHANVTWCPISATPSGQTNGIGQINGTPSGQKIPGNGNPIPVMVLWNTFLKKLFGL